MESTSVAKYKQNLPEFHTRGEQFRWFLKELARLALEVAERAKIKGIPEKNALDGLFDSVPVEILGTMVKPYVTSGEKYVQEEDLVGIAKVVAIISKAETVEEMVGQIDSVVQILVEDEDTKHRFFWLARTVGKLLKV